jgi:hypothetical protein
MSNTNKDKFILVYEECLYECVRDSPELYGYSIDNVSSAVKKMKNALDRMVFDYSGPAFKMACKRLGIEYSRQSINKFFQGK